MKNLIAALLLLAPAGTAWSQTVGELVAGGGTVTEIMDQSGYPLFFVSVPAGNRAGGVYVCRIDYESFFDFADYRKVPATDAIATTCARVE